MTPPTGAVTQIPVEDQLLQLVLEPYREPCKYLKQARVEVPSAEFDGDEEASPLLVQARGEFQIPGSWYIEDTGHFNAVEFNICYNQLVYTLIAQCVVSDLVPHLADMTLAEFKARQLPDILIVKYAAAFKKAMGSAQFEGTVGISSASRRGDLLLLKTHCRFWDPDGGHSEGDVTLAIVLRPLSAAQ